MDITLIDLYSRAMAVSEVIAESGSRVERKRARNRDALIAAARKLFSEQGFDATTIAGIAEAADLGFGTFYRYFPDKEAILQAVLDLGKAEMDAALTHPGNNGSPPAEALRQLTTRFAQAVRETRDVAELFWKVGVLGSAGPGAKRLVAGDLTPERQLPAILANTVAGIIKRGVNAGEFHTADPVLASRFIASAHMYLFGPTAADRPHKQIVEQLCDFELRALGFDPGARTSKRKGNGR